MIQIIIQILILLSTNAQSCNSTMMEVYTSSSLGRQDQLNRTFIKLQSTISVSDVSFVVNDTYKLKISHIKPYFYYEDSQQQTEIIGNETIVMRGARTDVRLEFDWMKQTAMGNMDTGGKGEAIAKSDGIMFAKIMKIDNQFLVQALEDYNNITFRKYQTNLTRINPPNTTKEDIEALKMAFNDFKGVKTALQNAIVENYGSYLNESVYQTRTKINNKFEYVWVDPLPSKGNLTIPYQISNIHLENEPKVFEMKFTFNITNYANWKCQYSAPIHPLSPQIYGSQQFLTFDAYKNTIKYAIEKGFFNTELNNDNWKSKMFQFYAGDLYPVIPQVANTFLASQAVRGNCTTSPSHLQVGKATYKTLNITFLSECFLTVKNSPISHFKIILTSIIEGKPHQNHLNFHIVEFEKKIDFIPIGGYKVENVELAELMIQYSLDGLKKGQIFGSGWTITAKDYPHFIIEEDYTIIYDSTHIDLKEYEER